jgi:hypothetical protein
MNDDRLRRLLSDAVSDVEPDDRFEELRASVRPRPVVVRVLHSRPWYAAAGIVAAVIGIVAYLTSVAGDNPTNAGPATPGGSGMHSATATATDTAAPSPPDDTDAGRSSVLAVYYLGSGPRGTVLYREFSPAPSSGTPLEQALAGLMRKPADPDYRTPWRAGWLRAASTGSGAIQVELGGAPESRPPSMTGRDASESVQQVVYTLQAALQRRDPVVFTRNGNPVTTVLGVPTSLPVSQGPPLDVLSRMSITNPGEGQVLPRGRLVVTGVNNSFEATVVVQLKRGGHAYKTKPGIASGYLAERLFPWRVVVNTSKLSPGRYTLVASTDDPSGRNRQETDTRVIELE